MELRQDGMLVAYWLTQVGIGPPGHMDYVKVPLRAVAAQRRTDGTPQVDIVGLFAANFNGSTTNFEPPYVTIADDMLAAMVRQPGQDQSDVEYLQAQGIKVVLSILGNNQITWGSVPGASATKFAAWLRTEIVDRYGLDGIDMDDEQGGTSAQPFVDVAGAVRASLDGKLLTKPLWADTDYFGVIVGPGFPNAGKKLAELLDFGWTMSYYGPATSLEGGIDDYLTGGMSREQLCIGVQAGPGGGQMTPVADVEEVARWVVDPSSPPIRGMMLFTFSQDIQQFTYDPQNSPNKMYPNLNDHEWQRAIIDGMTGGGS